MRHLEADPRLAEVPGLSRESLDALARSVELRRQQLEDDIRDYISRRQHDLRAYEQELLAQHRSMECLEDPENAAAASASAAEAESGSTAAVSASAAASNNADHKLAPEEKAKRTKHSRVQKREKELYGLVTPVFLPLLDARDVSEPKQETKKKSAPTPKPEQQQQRVAGGEVEALKGNEHATPAGEHGEKSSSKEGRKSRREHSSAAMQDRAASEPAQVETTTKKPKRLSTSSTSTTGTTKKSALRQHSSTKPRRKRVSLVIDGHTVLPADSVHEPALTSPSSEATSASNSTASLDEMLVDPRLTRAGAGGGVEPHIHTEHAGDAVHHSLPLPMSTNTIHSPTKPLVDTAPSSLTLAPVMTTSTTTTITPSYTVPSRPQPASLPSPDLEIPSPPHTTHHTENNVADEQQFNTYVGGLRGSSTDDVDQAGSYGYPSSLGASYLESYMQSRPLKVRMEAADRAGLEGSEREEMVKDKGDRRDKDEVKDEPKDVKHKRRDEEDDDDFMGEMDMEGF